MTNQHGRLAGVALALLVLSAAGCGSAPRTSHYTIEYAPPAGAASASTGSQLGVALPRASHLLRQDRIVYFTGPNEMNFYEYHRWAEPPNFMMQSLLIRQLRAAGLFDNIVPYRAQKGLDYVLQGRLLAMEEVDSPSGISARFGLELELVRQEDSHVVWTGRHNCERPVGAKTVPAVVEAMNGCVQESLGELTHSLGGAVAQFPPPATKPGANP